MKRRMKMAMSLLLATMVLAGPVAAHDFTGSEERKNSKVQTVYTNDVRCAKGEKANAQGVRVYQKQSGTTAGGVGVCNDGTGALGSRVPVQGRAVAQGSTGGGSVYIDGDKNNSPEQMKGWARVDGKFGPSAPTVRCGDEKGRRDASHPTSIDGREDCG
jgi:hypothetical protein